MLVEFRVANFRSMREEQVLSLVASKDAAQLKTNCVESGVKAVPHILRSGVVYGANASGKSNLIKAIQYMRGVVVESAALIQPGQTFSVQPFRLDSKSAELPTTFEVTFLLDRVRYQYGFSITSQRIVAEHLLVYKAFKPQKWFERRFDEETGKDVYEFGPALKGQKNVWEVATRANSLFLSMAVQLNSDALRPVFNWFQNQLVIINEVTPLTPQFSVEMIKNLSRKKEICDFLVAADISISDIDVITTKSSGQVLRFDLAVGKSEVATEEIEDNQIKFHHLTDAGAATFDLNEESSGTRNLFFLAGPILDILEKGIVLVVDELDTSLHTLIVREIVRLFHDPQMNVAGSQLIFTTHDTALLDTFGLFRRDQIWFVEKDNDQSSTLYSLLEFSPRKGEALERNYLQGRYGGIPVFSHILGAS